MGVKNPPSHLGAPRVQTSDSFAQGWLTCLSTKWEDGSGLCQGPHGRIPAAELLEADTELSTSRSRSRKKGRLSAKSWGPGNRVLVLLPNHPAG